MYERISKLTDKFTINPTKDIEPNFNKIKETDTLNFEIGKCPICGNDKIRRFPSSAWTRTDVCYHCETIIVVYYQDRLGGALCDVIYCYK
jgi:hypothetical protein